MSDAPVPAAGASSAPETAAAAGATGEPGWRADPDAPGTQRWWDGFAWAEHTRPAPLVHAAENRQFPKVEQPTYRLDTGTRWAAIIGWSPVWAGTIAQFFGVFGGGAGGAALVLVLAYLVVIGLAALDVRELRYRGANLVASPAWALLGPFGYLIARRTIVGREDRGALLVLIIFVSIIVVLASITYAIQVGFDALYELQSQQEEHP